MKLRLNPQEIERAKNASGCSTYGEFAEQVGISRMTLNRAVRGEGFNSSTLAVLVGAGAQLTKLVIQC